MTKAEQKKIISKKNKLVSKLRNMLDTELDDVLQGDYEERGFILSEFEDIIDHIDEYKI